MPATAERTVPARQAPAPIDPPDPRLFEANLRAIAKRQAELADLLAAVDIRECVRFFRGRDGSVTARVLDADGAWRWLGCSSAPAVSAPQLVGRFSLEPMNVALVGTGSGRELIELAGRTHYHQAIFCLVEDGPGPDGLAAAAAVLRLVDLSELLSSGRLVLAGCDGVTALNEFLRRHVGFAPPGQVLPWPWQSPEQFAAITARVHAICERRVGEVARDAERVARRFHAKLHVAGTRAHRGNGRAGRRGAARGDRGAVRGGESNAHARAETGAREGEGEGESESESGGEGEGEGESEGEGEGEGESEGEGEGEGEGQEMCQRCPGSAHRRESARSLFDFTAVLDRVQAAAAR